MVDGGAQNKSSLKLISQLIPLYDSIIGATNKKKEETKTAQRNHLITFQNQFHLHLPVVQPVVRQCLVIAIPSILL